MKRNSINFFLLHYCFSFLLHTLFLLCAAFFCISTTIDAYAQERSSLRNDVLKNVSTTATPNIPLDSIQSGSDSLAAMPEFPVADSLNLDARYAWIHLMRGLDNYTLLPLDTALHNFHQYSQLERQPYRYRPLGAVAQPLLPLFFHYSDSIFFDSGYHIFDGYLLQPQDLSYFDPKAPYTDIFYVIGSGKEQQMHLTHAQSLVQQRFRYTLEWLNTSADGFYQRQKAKATSLHVSLWYSSRNSRYHSIVGLLNHRQSAEQNGGVATFNIFNDTSVLRKDVLPIQLSKANISNRQRTWQWHQWYDFSSRDTILVARIDTLKKDTVLQKIAIPTAQWRLSHTVRYRRETYGYSDAEIPAGFYSHIFADSSSTSDEWLLEGWRNEATFQFDAKQDTLRSISPLHIRAGAYYETFTLSPTIYYADSLSFSFKEYEQNIAAYCEAILRQRFWYVKAKWQQGVAGYNGKDLMWHSQGGIFPFQKLRLEAALTYSRRAPAALFRSAFGNHYQWRHDAWKQQQHFQTEISIGNMQQSHQIRLLRHDFTDYLVFNAQQEPEQIDNWQLWQVQQWSRLRWRKWNWEHTIMWQKSSLERISLPQWCIDAQVYYRNHLFGGNLLLEAGMRFRYNSNFYAPAFSPALQQFYLQDTNTILLGYYPLTDVFLNFRISRARFFVASQHLNQAILNKRSGYFAAPHYPALERTIRLGFSWMFYD
ncbi:MAG: hypothetical protein IPL35_11425 [Sphingobacteriales bacterium]|nr:hypothetical protein [Sphingobacteriales bacterium]